METQKIRIQLLFRKHARREWNEIFEMLKKRYINVLPECAFEGYVSNFQLEEVLHKDAGASQK
jgi:hypothetical protein